MAAADEIMAATRRTLPYTVRVTKAAPGVRQGAVYVCDAFTRRHVKSREELNWIYFTGQAQQPPAGHSEAQIDGRIIAGLVDITGR